jgi:nucleotide-binding universal stress UspA family protein
MKFHHIVAAVDGSLHSRKAVDCAAELARANGAKLTIVHVVLPVFKPYSRRELRDPARLGNSDWAEYQRLEKFGKSIIAAATKRASKRQVQQIEALVEFGDPVENILRVAQDRKAGLIVLGRRGLGSLASVILGSVSYKITQASTVPVLIVP